MGWEKSDAGALKMCIEEGVARCGPAEGCKEKVSPAMFRTSERRSFACTLGEAGAEQFFFELIDFSAKKGCWTPMQIGQYSGERQMVQDFLDCGMITRVKLENGNYEINITDMGVFYFAVHYQLLK